MWKGVCFFWIFGPKPPKNLVVYVWKVNRSGFWKVVQVENVRSWKIYVWRGGWVYALYIAEDVLLLCFRKQEFFPFLLGSPFNTWFFLVLVRIRQAASAISFTYFGSMRNGICTSWMFNSTNWFMKECVIWVYLFCYPICLWYQFINFCVWCIPSKLTDDDFVITKQIWLAGMEWLIPDIITNKQYKFEKFSPWSKHPVCDTTK